MLPTICSTISTPQKTFYDTNKSTFSWCYGYGHGDLNSYDGYGTDAVVYLKTLTHEATELLPVFNKTSTKQYKSAIPIADWTDPAFSGATKGSYQGGHWT